MEKKQGSRWWNRFKSGSEQKKGFSLRKDQLLIGLLTGILLIVIAWPMESGSRNVGKTGLSGIGSRDSKEEDAGGAVSEDDEKNRLASMGSTASDVYTREMEDRLAEILSRVEGVGKAKVMITWKSSAEKVVEKDRPGSSQRIEETDSNGGTRFTEEETAEMETVYAEESSGIRTPYVVKELKPQAEGVLVIAQGGGNALVAQQILEAVQALFPLETHKIKIMKMEGSQ